ncbi:polysaccharide biosynthesis C-terminal domain-containing protein [bacterium]|nr:polysaccharide biosynthesis C-terminal domain-containing protein [bacterium]
MPSTGAKDTAVAFTSRIIVLLISLAIQSTLAWLLGPDGRGAYAVCLLFATLLGTCFAFGMDTAGQYFVASKRMSVSEGVWATVGGLLAASLVAVLVGRVLMEFDLAFLAKAPRDSFYVALAVVPFHVVGQGCILLLVGLGRIKWMAVTAIVNAVTQLAAALLLIRWLGLGVNGALLAIVAAGAVNILLGFTAFRREGALKRIRFKLSHTKRIVAYGARFYVARLSSAMYVRVGTMILAFFAPAGDIGVFAAASGLVSRILFVPTSIETALFSRVAADARGRPEAVGRAARVSGLVSGAMLLVLGMLSRPVVVVLLSPEFAKAVTLIWIMIPGVFVRAAAKVLMSYFTGTNRPSVCSWAIGAGMAANIGAIFVLLPLIGLEGAAWAMTIGFVVSSAVLVVAFRRVTGLSLAATWAPRRADIEVLMEVLRDVRSRIGRGRTGSG